jgi:hypothetical protein
MHWRGLLLNSIARPNSCISSTNISPLTPCLKRVNHARSDEPPPNSSSSRGPTTSPMVIILSSLHTADSFTSLICDCKHCRYCWVSVISTGHKRLDANKPSYSGAHVVYFPASKTPLWPSFRSTQLCEGNRPAAWQGALPESRRCHGGVCLERWRPGGRGGEQGVLYRRRSGAAHRRRLASFVRTSELCLLPRNTSRRPPPSHTGNWSLAARQRAWWTYSPRLKLHMVFRDRHFSPDQVVESWHVRPATNAEARSQMRTWVGVARGLLRDQDMAASSVGSTSL